VICSPKVEYRAGPALQMADAVAVAAVALQTKWLQEDAANLNVGLVGGSRMGDSLDDLIEAYLMRLCSPRSHFVGLVCFWSLWTLSVSPLKAAVVAVFATCFMVLNLERRAVTTAVLALTIIACGTYVGVSLDDVKRLAANLNQPPG
jgi:hypothetical protein